MTIQGEHLGRHASAQKSASRGTGALTSEGVNISPVERAGRLGLGAAAVVVAVVLLFLASSALAVILELLLLAAGADLLVTGITGHCPLYQRLGHVPRVLRGSR